MENNLPLLLLALWMIPASASADLERAAKAFEAGDYDLALREWTLLAEAGDPVAQNGLCVMYTVGKGVPKDEARAFDWCCKAAEQGSDAAQNNIGMMYLFGQGVKMNKPQALGWLWKSADQGNVHAQHSIRMLEGEDNMLTLEKYRRPKINTRFLTERNPRCR